MMNHHCETIQIENQRDTSAQFLRDGVHERSVSDVVCTFVIAAAMLG